MIHSPIMLKRHTDDIIDFNSARSISTVILVVAIVGPLFGAYLTFTNLQPYLALGIFTGFLVSALTSITVARNRSRVSSLARIQISISVVLLLIVLLVCLCATSEIVDWVFGGIIAIPFSLLLSMTWGAHPYRMTVERFREEERVFLRITDRRLLYSAITVVHMPSGSHLSFKAAPKGGGLFKERTHFHFLRIMRADGTVEEAKIAPVQETGFAPLVKLLPLLSGYTLELDEIPKTNASLFLPTLAAVSLIVPAGSPSGDFRSVEELPSIIAAASFKQKTPRSAWRIAILALLFGVLTLLLAAGEVYLLVNSVLGHYGFQQFIRSVLFFFIMWPLMSFILGRIAISGFSIWLGKLDVIVNADELELSYRLFFFPPTRVTIPLLMNPVVRVLGQNVTVVLLKDGTPYYSHPIGKLRDKRELSACGQPRRQI